MLASGAIGLAFFLIALLLFYWRVVQKKKPETSLNVPYLVVVYAKNRLSEKGSKLLKPLKFAKVHPVPVEIPANRQSNEEQ